LVTTPREIPIFKSHLPRPENWLRYLEKAYETSKFSNFGEASHDLEKRVAEFLGIESRKVVTCVNATLALSGAVATAEKNQLSWTIPSWTFTATAAAMITANKNFYFSDVDENWRIDPIDKKVNLIDVLPFGDGIDISRLENLCQGEIVIDGAASFDALRFANLNTIKRRYGLVISFHPTKFPPGPEGAVFISNDEEWCENFRSWTIFGMDEKRISYFPGTNAKLNEFSSAVILSSLDEYFPNREELLISSKKAMSLSQECGFDVINSMRMGIASPYWIIKNTQKKIQEVESFFAKELINTRRWWMYGCHTMQAYSSIVASDLRMTIKASKCSLGLPMYLGMSEGDWVRISNALRKIKSKT
jgi:dTDP-4-amino-4,6-dideoxygalactose transaminase